MSNVEVIGPLPPRNPTIPLPINPVIAQETGLDLSVVQAAVGYFRSIKLLPRPADVEESRKRLSESKSYNPKLEEEWLSIRELALIGMSPREIHEALIYDKQLDIPVHSLSQRIYRKTKREGFDRKDEGYESNIRKTVLSATDEEIKGRVRLWLDVKRVWVEQGKPLPATRIEWMSILKEAVQSFGEVKAILVKVGSGSLEFIPGTLYEWELLAKLLEARRIIQQTGIKPSDSEQLNGLTEEFGQLPRERSDALKSCIAVIIKATPLQNGFVIEIS